MHEFVKQHRLKVVEKSKNCDCYQCIGSEVEWSQDGHKTVTNNVKYHTFMEPCDGCGRPKTEYLDLGTKGYYTCWWCNER